MAARNKDHADDDADAVALLEALRHPLRRQILKSMGTSEYPISPSQLADELGVPLSNLSYHVRVLAAKGAIVMDNVAPVRGSLQHFYEITIGEDWALGILGIDGHDADTASK